MRYVIDGIGENHPPEGDYPALNTILPMRYIPTGYRNLKFEFPHAVVRHTKGEYVRGVVHTNSIEGFWSMFKRGIIGNFHHISRAYMPLYANEFEFRHNHRDDLNAFGTIIASC